MMIVKGASGNRTSMPVLMCYTFFISCTMYTVHCTVTNGWHGIAKYYAFGTAKDFQNSHIRETDHSSSEMSETYKFKYFVGIANMPKWYTTNIHLHFRYWFYWYLNKRFGCHRQDKRSRMEASRKIGKLLVAAITQHVSYAYLLLVLYTVGIEL